MTDDRRTQAALFHQASKLRSDLTAVASLLPKPDFSPIRPSGWTDAHSYANCVERLRDVLDTSFVVSDLPAAEMAGGGARGEPFAVVATLFHQARELLSDLTALGKRLPDPEVEKVRARIAGALHMVMTELRVREEWQILSALSEPRQ
jgi:hypothetical protein